MATEARAISRETRAAGAVAAAVQLAAGELAAALLPGARGPIAGLVQQTIHTTPGPAVDAAIALVESADKALLRTAAVVESLAVGAAMAQRPALGPAVLGTTSTAAAALCPDSATGPTIAAGAAGTAAGAAARRLLVPPPGRTAARRLLQRQAAGDRLVAGCAVAGATAIAAVAVDRARLRRLEAKRRGRRLPPITAPPADADLDVAGISPLYTPAESFYTTDVTARPPRLDADQWRLRVHGMVDRELKLSLEELAGLGLVELDATLVCVHNPVGGDRIGSARWAGVPLERLLEHAGVHGDAEQLLARSVDGFTAGVPVERIRSGSPALLAVALNGEPLPFEHGYPVRLLIPGLWGADANTKWVTELELTTWDAVRDYWDRRGWPRQPTRVQPASRIDVPANRARLEAGRVVVAGVAWAPPEGVEGVEVRIDDGPWQPTELGVEMAPTMWRQWSFAWQAAPGDHALTVRTRGRTRLQPGGAEPPYPVGSRGHHEVRVSVTPTHAAEALPPNAIAIGLPAGPMRGRAFADDVRDRVLLAARGLSAWRERGFPPAPRFPAPRERA
jgi:DMSO/TMAO reductase YedYZ molybdopterin-dependent catalytic subunit